MGPYHRCRACRDPIGPASQDRREWPKSARYSPGDYCRTCYMELVAGVIPNVCVTRDTGKDHLTYRQAMKLGQTGS